MDADPDPSADRRAITDLLVRYATGVDRRDWALLRSCWTDDATADYDTLGRFEDPEALTGVMRSTHEGMGPTYHRITNVAIDLEPGADTATARSYVHAVLMILPGDQENWVEAVGHYDDKLVRVGAGWRIRHRVSVVARLTSGGPMVAGLAAATAADGTAGEGA